VSLWQCHREGRQNIPLAGEKMTANGLILVHAPLGIALQKTPVTLNGSEHEYTGPSSLDNLLEIGTIKVRIIR
jgi:hypothetical protein